MMNGPEPTLRTIQEIERREDCYRNSKVETKQPRSNQTHIVIERKPANSYVTGSHLNGLTDGANVGYQVSMRQRNALGVARASRSVLDQCQVSAQRLNRSSRGSFA